MRQLDLFEGTEHAPKRVTILAYKTDKGNVYRDTTPEEEEERWEGVAQWFGREKTKV
jgi:hypothetical protein